MRSVPFFGGLRANSKYAEGTSLLNGLSGIDDPTIRRDTLRRAIESLTAATELKPDFGPAWHNLGHAYYYSGQLLIEVANALEESSESSDASPDSKVGFFRESAIATYKNSLKVLDVAVKLMPDAAEVHNSRGRTLVVLHRDEEASNEFNIAAGIDPSYCAAVDNQNTLGVLTKAEEAFDKLGTLITSFREQGDAFYNAGQYTKAISVYSEIIALSPFDTQAYRTRGASYNSLGQSELAIKDFDTSIQFGTEDAWVYRSLGKAYRHLEQYEKSLEAYEKGVELAPDDFVSYVGRGLVYESLDRYQHAIQDYGKAMELEPNNPEHYYRRERTYRQIGEKDLAEKDHSKAQELEEDDASNFGTTPS